jgi:hypothetical protein
VLPLFLLRPRSKISYEDFEVPARNLWLHITGGRSSSPPYCCHLYAHERYACLPFFILNITFIYVEHTARIDSISTLIQLHCLNTVLQLFLTVTIGYSS